MARDDGEVGGQHSASHRVKTSSGVKVKSKSPVDRQSNSRASGFLFTQASPRNGAVESQRKSIISDFLSTL